MNAPERLESSGSIGDILVQRGLLQRHDIERVIERQRAKGEPFGEAAIALNLLRREDLQAALSTQFNYGYLREGEHALSPELVVAFKPFSRAAEEMRALRSQLLMRWFTGDPRRRVISVVSNGAGDGRTFIAANLAVAFSQQGHRTLLIDADLRKPRLGQLFCTANSAGLAGVLSDRAGLDIAEPVVGLPGLRVLPAGAVPPNPQELVGKPAFGDLLGAASAQHDVVIIDTPPCDGVADAEIVSARTGAALVVVRKHRSLLKGTRQLARRLQDTGVALVGTVLNHY